MKKWLFGLLTLIMIGSSIAVAMPNFSNYVCEDGNVEVSTPATQKPQQPNADNDNSDKEKNDNDKASEKYNSQEPDEPSQPEEVKEYEYRDKLTELKQTKRSVENIDYEIKKMERKQERINSNNIDYDEIERDLQRKEQQLTDTQERLSKLVIIQEELERQFRALKKGSKLGSGPLAAAAITSLINAAPAIISALKQKQGSGESAPDTEDVLKLMKQIQNQKKYIKNGEVGSGKLGDFFSKAWKKVKGLYNNNKELLQPIMNSLGDYAKDSAQKYINKGADYLSSKTSNEHLKKAIDTAKDITTDIKNDAVNKVVGSGVDSSILPDNDFDNLNELAESIEHNKNVIKKKGTSNKLQTVPGFAMSQTTIKPTRFKRMRTNQVYI